MKSILVPAIVYDEVKEALATFPIDVELVRYGEDSEPVPGLDHVEAIYRWIAGGRFSELVRQGPAIQWLHTASAGVDHVLTPDVKGRSGIVVTDSGPAFGPAIAEFVLAAMLSNVRRLPELRQNQIAHRWQHVDQTELSGSVIGIIGLGPIGIAIAKRAKAFDMHTIGLRRADRTAEFVDEVFTGGNGLKQVLERSDFLVIAAALTGETRSLVGKEELRSMKPGALLINIARGGLIDEPALIEALRSDTISGAVLDVFAKEPLAQDSPLWDLQNVLVSPHHSGGGSPSLRKRQIDIFVENVRRWSTNNPLLNQVDIGRGY